MVKPIQLNVTSVLTSSAWLLGGQANPNGDLFDTSPLQLGMSWHVDPFFGFVKYWMYWKTATEIGSRLVCRLTAYF